MTGPPATELRALTRADADAIQRIYSAQAVRLLGRPAMTNRQDAESWLAHALARQQTVPWQRVTWGITTDNDLIGIVRLDRTLTHEPNGTEAGLSYILRQDAWGQGHATRAVRAALSLAFTTLGLLVIRARHHPDNQASAHVLARTGFTPTGATAPAVTYVATSDTAWSPPLRAVAPSPTGRVSGLPGPLSPARVRPGGRRGWGRGRRLPGST